jgi:Gpi18-like mannosyltransferase
MKKYDYFFIFESFLIWLAVLFLILFLAVHFLPSQKELLGGGLANYIKNPYFWSWGNFDGEHYVFIAQNGYKPLTYFFFPLYPILIRYFSGIFGQGMIPLVKSGMMISYLSFAAALVGFYKLLKLDFKENFIRNSILLLLIFPTSFFFASIYTESLFLAVTVWSFYFARKKNWISAGILGALATATRVIGVALVAALAAEVFMAWRKDKKINLIIPIIGILISLSGIGIYIYYVWIKTGDPLNFMKTVGVFGAQRSTSLIILPQVFYRYIFEILPNLNYKVFISFYPSVLEFVVGTVFLGLSILAFWKVRLSYAVFLALGYLIPTLAGSFSSMPRYILVLFPAFILASTYLGKNKYLLFAFCTLSFILLVVSFSLFARGYWIS